MVRILEGLPDVVRVRQEGDDRYIVEASRDLRAQVTEAIVKAGGQVLRLSLEEPGLDEVYAHHFGQEVANAAT